MLINHIGFVLYVPKGSTAERKEQTQLTKWEINAQKEQKNFTGKIQQSKSILLIN